jgi:hypothetical protein
MNNLFFGKHEKNSTEQFFSGKRKKSAKKFFSLWNPGLLRVSGAHCLGCAVANSVTGTGRTVKTPRGRADAVVANSQPTLRTSRRLRVARLVFREKNHNTLRNHSRQIRSNRHVRSDVSNSAMPKTPPILTVFRSLYHGLRLASDQRRSLDRYIIHIYCVSWLTIFQIR